MNAGDTFRFSFGGHLWVVLSDPIVDPASVLVVNLTTSRGLRHEDHSCLLDNGDHPFVRHLTLINYRDAFTKPNSELDGMLSSGRIILHDPLSEEVLERIREGAALSELILFGYRKLLVEQGLIT